MNDISLCNKNLSIKEIQSIEIEILDYVVAICEKHNLKYFLCAGTLLGAIRHKGFIPWDDDIDIVMPRPDYEILLDILQKQNDGKFQILVPNKDGYYYEFAKVVDSTTIVDQANADNIKNLGIWIDIFVLDALNPQDKWHDLLLKFYQRCRVASIYKVLPKKCGVFKYPLSLYCKLCRMIGWEYFLGKILKLSKKYNYDSTDYIGYAPSIMNNKCMPKEWFSETVMVIFEHKTYKAPKEWDKYLTALYGNYMALPPIENRIPHSVMAFKK